MSWRDDRDLGAWPFTKTHGKPRYNEGNRMATSANPVWTMDFSGKPVTPTHYPGCGYWIGGPATPDVPIEPDIPTGILWACGDDSSDQITISGLTYNYSFKLVSNEYCRSVKNVGSASSLIITREGILKGTGRNDYGQLGLGDKDPRSTFTIVDSNEWQNVSGGWYSSLALRADGRLYGSGLNGRGELGLEDFDERLLFTYAKSNISKISLCASHSLIINSSGQLFGAGKNVNGELGLGDTTNRNVFTRIGVSTIWAEVATGNAHSAALKSDGRLYTSGYNSAGMLGTGDNTTRTSFTHVLSDVAQVSIGGSVATYAIKTDGTLWTTGSNVLGELGLGDLESRNEFTQVSGGDWKYVASGSHFAMAMKNDGSLYSTGTSTNGRLGLGDNVNRNIFTRVPSISCINLFLGHNCAFIVRSAT